MYWTPRHLQHSHIFFCSLTPTCPLHSLLQPESFMMDQVDLSLNEKGVENAKTKGLKRKRATSEQMVTKLMKAKEHRTNFSRACYALSSQ